MIAKITKGIKISVETFFQDDYSAPINDEYLFAYRITIENTGDQPVQLLRRHWFIIDSTGEHREVEGEGVIGNQPSIDPGKSFQYVSACNLHSEFGTMHGYYLMVNLYTKKQFKVEIPKFNMITPGKVN